MFNFEAAMARFDNKFQEIIQKTEGKFQFAQLRKTVTRDPQTRVSMESLNVVSTDVGNWNHPLQRITYEIEGVVYGVDGIIFVVTPGDYQQTDVIYNMESDKAYRVLGTVEYSSHTELHVAHYVIGQQFKVQQPTGFIGSEVDVVSA